MVEFTNQLSSDQYFSLSWDSQNTYFTCGQASAIRNELISLSLTGVPILPSYISTSNLWENVVSKSSSSVSNSANQFESYWRRYMCMCILFTQRAVGTMNCRTMQKTGDFFQALTKFYFPEQSLSIISTDSADTWAESCFGAFYLIEFKGRFLVYTRHLEVSMNLTSSDCRLCYIFIFYEIYVNTSHSRIKKVLCTFILN